MTVNIISPQVLASLESLYLSIPKIKRSKSEPTIHRTDSFDLDFKYMCASPRTPINSQFNTKFLFTGGNIWQDNSSTNHCSNCPPHTRGRPTFGVCVWFSAGGCLEKPVVKSRVDLISYQLNWFVSCLTFVNPKRSRHYHLTWSESNTCDWSMWTQTWSVWWGMSPVSFRPNPYMIVLIYSPAIFWSFQNKWIYISMQIG